MTLPDDAVIGEIELADKMIARPACDPYSEEPTKTEPIWASDLSPEFQRYLKALENTVEHLRWSIYENYCGECGADEECDAMAEVQAAKEALA